MTTRVMNSLAGTESFLQEREGSGRAIAVPDVPVMRMNTLRGRSSALNIHKYQLTCYRNNDLAHFWKTSVTCQRGFAQPSGQGLPGRHMNYLERENAALEVCGRLGHVLGLAQIAPVIWVGAEGDDSLSLGGQAQVGGDDREHTLLGDHAEELRGNDMNPGECQRCGLLRRADHLGRIGAGLPSAKLAAFVEQEVAGGLALLHGQGSERLVFVMKRQHTREVDRADDVDIVEQERFLTLAVLKEEPFGLLQSAAGIEQDIVFARDLNTHSEVVVILQVIDNHVGEVMHVDDYVLDSEGGETAKGDLQQRVPGNFYQCLGAVIGQGPQAGTEPCGKNHGLHVAAFSAAEFSAFILSSSRCVTTTSTPLRPRRRLATCSAR